MVMVLSCHIEYSLAIVCQRMNLFKIRRWRNDPLTYPGGSEPCTVDSGEVAVSPQQVDTRVKVKNRSCTIPKRYITPIVSQPDPTYKRKGQSISKNDRFQKAAVPCVSCFLRPPPFPSEQLAPPVLLHLQDITPSTNNPNNNSKPTHP